MYQHRLSMSVLLRSSVWLTLLTDVTLTAAASQASRETAAIESGLARVRLHVVDSEGRPVKWDQRTESVIRQIDGNWRGTFDNTLSVKHVPYGTYEVVVRPFGFETTTRYFEVNEPNVWLAVSVEVGRIFERPRPMVQGKVMPPPPRGAAVWIKLVSVFSGFVAEVLVDASGAFVFNRLPHSGPHVLIAVRQGPAGAEVFSVSRVEVKLFEPTVITVEFTEHNQGR